MKYLYFFIVLITFSKCSEDKINIKKEFVQVKVNKDSLEILNAANLIRKYNAVNLDKDSSIYSFELQSLLDSNKGNLLIKGDIIDVVKNKSNYTLIISTYHSFAFRIKSVINIDSIKFNKLKSELDGEIYSGYFIIKVNSISSLFPLLVADKDSDNNSELTYDLFDKVFKLKGELVDFQKSYN